MNSLERFFDRLDVSNKGYTVNKVFMRIVFGSLFLLLLVIGFSYGFSFSWAECPADAVGGYCENPFYEEFCFTDSFCDEPVISAGSVVGVKPPLVASLFPYFAVVVVFVALFINHVLYNKGYFRRRKNGFI